MLVPLVGVGLVAAAWAAPEPSYDPSKARWYATMAKEHLTRRGVLAVDRADQRIPVKRLGPDSLPFPGLVALMTLPPAGDAEHWPTSCVLVPEQGRGFVPVELRRIEKRMEVRFGPVFDPATWSTSVDDLLDRWPVGPIQSAGRRWAPHEAAAVDQAFRRLGEEELALLPRLELRRQREDPTGRGHAGDFHLEQDGRSQIRIFDAAFPVGTLRIGCPATAPAPSGTEEVLHEIGHAFAAVPKARLVAAYGRARLEILEQQQAMKARYDDLMARRKAPASRRTTNEEVAAYDVDRRRMETRRAALPPLHALTTAWDAQSPVEAAYAATHARTANGPTEYGRTHLRESFAEAFRIWHMDPEGYTLRYPEAGAWFAAGGHITAAKDAVAEAEAAIAAAGLSVDGQLDAVP